ncbi:conserved hypothetical protein [uncultured Pleomorphomonas sp.]|uniref:Uncharacterized protein n=2 Tax=uncultured Pleomorphomonas sp. TaxID=442121 RepID=A0A212LPT6_9HYPH|nr:conserved hypothetical protein [uncultured Pleomorphomonas sp.]
MQGIPPALLVKGEFAFSDDPAVLAREVGATGAKVVFFDSDGGNIVAAMAYGRTIRSLGLWTFQLRSDQCASACALAFVGGVVRHAQPGSIGVHQSSFSPESNFDGDTAVAAIQSITADIMAYLIEMGIDPKLLQLSLSVPPNDMRYLTASEMAQYKITSTEKIDLQAAAPVGIQAKPTVPSSGIVPKPIEPTTEDKAIAFMAGYYDTWSRPNADALAFLDNAYADTIEFYDKTTSKEVVLDEKRKFADRWPKRAYNVRHGSEHVSCSGLCTMTGIVEWFTESPVRARVSSGIAEFTLMWDASTGKLVSENGLVLAIDKNAAEPFRIILQWHDENGKCRGGSGASDETEKACRRREVIGAKLDAVGWCYGHPGEYGYQTNWHRCDGGEVASADAKAAGSTIRTKLRPADYAVRAIFSGKTQLPDFKNRDRDFNTYRTRIREGMRAGPNYAGRYSVIQIGCGTGCSFVIVGDNQTGRPMSFPRGGEDNMYLQLQFQLDSRLLTAQWANYDSGKCYVEWFDFDGGSWKVLNKFEAGNIDACYKDIAENVK